jgi:hypothetical protein
MLNFFTATSDSSPGRALAPSSSGRASSRISTGFGGAGICRQIQFLFFPATGRSARETPVEFFFPFAADEEKSGALEARKTGQSQLEMKQTDRNGRTDRLCKCYLTHNRVIITKTLHTYVQP